MVKEIKKMMMGVQYLNTLNEFNIKRGPSYLYTDKTPFTQIQLHNLNEIAVNKKQRMNHTLAYF